MAYERVKSIWTRRGIWWERWGVLPGMSWKHELPFEEVHREEADDAIEGEESWWFCFQFAGFGRTP